MLGLLIRLLAYPALGAVGAYELGLALAGNFNFWAAFAIPVLMLWIVAGFVLAFLRQQAGLPSAYVFGNLGIVAGSLIGILVAITVHVVNHEYAQTLPLQIVWLLLIFGGLLGGGMMGPRIVHNIAGRVGKSLKPR